MPTSEPTADALVSAPYREGICNVIRKDGKPCVQRAAADSLRCTFHADPAKHPLIYATPPAAPSEEHPRAADRIAAALNAGPLDDPEAFRISADVQESAGDAGDDEPPYPQEAADEAAGMVRRYVYDEDTKDYVEKLVPIEDTPAYVTDADEYHDEFELGAAYHTGREADFDHRWIHEDPKKNLNDRKNGFVPMTKALDNQFREEGGAVRFGDLILAHRPKELTRERARQQALLHDRRVGQPVEKYKQEAASLGNVEPFGSETSSRDMAELSPEQIRDARRQTQADRQPEPRGRKLFAINAPFQRDKLAEKAAAERLASVGG